MGRNTDLFVDELIERYPALDVCRPDIMAAY